MSVVTMSGGPLDQLPTMEQVVLEFLKQTGAVPTADIAGRTGKTLDPRAMRAILRRLERAGKLESKIGSTDIGRTLLWFIPGKETVRQRSWQAPNDDDPHPTTPVAAALRA